MGKAMDRRDFIKTTAAAAAAAAAGTSAANASPSSVATPHVATGIRELRIAMSWPQNGRGFDDSARRLALSIATLSAGRYRLSVSPHREGIDALSSGRADLYHGAGHDFVALDRAFAYFAGLPGSNALRPTYLNAWLMAGGGQTLWDDLAARYGFKPLLVGHSGARAGLWSRNPVTNVDDLQGLRIAASGLSADVVTALGARAVSVTPADVALALAENRIDAVEWGGTLAAFGCDLHAVATHCQRPGLSRSGFSTVLAVSATVWADLPEADQAVFAAAAAQELNHVVAENLGVAGKLRAALSERHGLSFTSMPGDITASAKHAADQVIAEVASATPEAARIHASYTAFRGALPAPRRRRPETPVA